MRSQNRNRQGRIKAWAETAKFRANKHNASWHLRGKHVQQLVKKQNERKA